MKIVNFAYIIWIALTGNSTIPYTTELVPYYEQHVTNLSKPFIGHKGETRYCVYVCG